MKLIMTLGLIAALPTLGSAATAYDQAKETLNNAPANIKAVMETAPKTYSFKSRFDGASSVSFTGQTFRHILMNDLKSYMGSLKIGSYPGITQMSYDALMSYVSYDSQALVSAPGMINADSLFKTKAKDLDGLSVDINEGYFYGDIQNPGKNLISKMAGNDNPLRRGVLKGWDQEGIETPEQLVTSWLKVVAEQNVDGSTFTVPNGSLPAQRVGAAVVTKEGLDMTQLVQKFFHGAISFSQASGDYLSTSLSAKKGLNADNELPYKGSKNYTALEHFYDEGFGYFGAARDYGLYSKKDVYDKKSMDSNGDGEISILTEMNLGLARNAARFDLASTNPKTDFRGEIFNSFIKGRHLISERPENYRKYVVANARVALGAWEKVLAATTIHYINVTVKEMNEYGTKDYLFKNFAKYWGEMKGFALAAQFSPTAILSDSDFDQVHQLMRSKPVLPHSSGVDQYKKDLLAARKILQNAYNFSSENVNNW
jgi:hypothetical protein